MNAQRPPSLPTGAFVINPLPELTHARTSHPRRKTAAASVCDGQAKCAIHSAQMYGLGRGVNGKNPPSSRARPADCFVATRPAITSEPMSSRTCVGLTSRLRGFCLHLGPGVAEADGAVEDGPRGGAVAVSAEIAETLELHHFTFRR